MVHHLFHQPRHLMALDCGSQWWIAVDGVYSANCRFILRFCRPLFSILLILIGPISAVLRMWVPPQGCKSIPATSISRTQPAPTGGLTDIVRTSSRRGFRSASGVPHGVN